MRRGKKRREATTTSSLALHCCNYLLIGFMLMAVGLILMHVHKMHMVLVNHVEVVGHAHETLTNNKISAEKATSSSSIGSSSSSSSSIGSIGSIGSSSSSSSGSGKSHGVHFPKCTFDIEPSCQLDQNLKYWREPPDCLR